MQISTSIMIDITVGIPTLNRHEELARNLVSIAFQTLKPKEVIIVDDAKGEIDFRTITSLNYAFHLLDFYNIKWQVIYGKGLGQHFSHQTIQDLATTEFIYKSDDDTILEPNVLELLSQQMIEKKVGAVAPSILWSDKIMDKPSDLQNKISNITASPNVQWFLSFEVQTAEHLYSCFLYRKGIAKFNLNLSRKAHREETIFTYDIFQKNYKLLIEPNAKVWHFQCKTGGIREDNNEEDFVHDEKIFNQYLENLKKDRKHFSFHVYLNNGIGDHFAFKHILNDIIVRYGHVTIGCCYNDVFFDIDKTEISLISLADMDKIFKIYGRQTDDHNIYKYMWDKNANYNLVQAYKEIYLENSNNFYF